MCRQRRPRIHRRRDLIRSRSSMPDAHNDAATDQCPDVFNGARPMRRESDEPDATLSHSLPAPKLLDIRGTNQLHGMRPARSVLRAEVRALYMEPSYAAPMGQLHLRPAEIS